MCALIGLVGSAVAYVRTVRTGSGAVAVQIVWSSRRGSRRIEHLGSAHDSRKLNPALLPLTHAYLQNWCDEASWPVHGTNSPAHQIISSTRHSPPHNPHRGLIVNFTPTKRS